MFISEEDEVIYSNLEDLSFFILSDEDSYEVELYICGKFVGYCNLWYDSEMNDRPYIILNYEIIYLDTILPYESLAIQ